jgi:uncharacterized protein YjdB
VLLNDLYAVGPGETVEFDVYIKQVDGNSMADLASLMTVKVTSETRPSNTATLAVNGIQLTTGVTLNKTFLSLLRGQSEQLIATVLPANATNKNVIWSSDSPYVLNVDQNGVVTTHGAGSAVITVTTVDSGFTASCYVLVGVPVTSITVSPSAVSVDYGQSYWLTATVEPFNAGEANVTWSSSNPSAVTVNQAGIVRAVGGGSAVISATALDGSGVSGTAIVNVTNIPVTGVTLRGAATITSIGGTLQLTPTVLPVYASNKNVTWSSSLPGVASVDANGLVTALSVGNTVITVRTVDGGFTATCTVYVYVTLPLDPSSDVIPEQPELPTGTPAGIVSAEPIIFIPSVSTDISLESDMLSTVLPGFSSGDFRVNEYGVITLQDWLAREIAEELLHINLAEVKMLPVFEAVLHNPGDIGAVSFLVKGSHLMVDGLISRPENVRLLMALSSTSGDWFTYAGTASALDDRKFTILDMSNGIFTGELDPNATYKLLFLIKDGGAFDLDRETDATIWGAMAFVGVPVMGVTLSPNNINLLTGQSFDWTPGVAFVPPIADNKKLTWSNNNLYIASISPQGIYTTTGAGSDTITVRTVDGGFWDRSSAIVAFPVSSISIYPPTTTISVGEMMFLSAYVLPVSANDGLTWESSNPAAATVNYAGRLQGVAPGTATITATAIDGSGVTGTCNVTVVP